MFIVFIEDGVNLRTGDDLSELASNFQRDLVVGVILGELFEMKAHQNGKLLVGGGVSHVLVGFVGFVGLISHGGLGGVFHILEKSVLIHF